MGIISPKPNNTRGRNALTGGDRASLGYTGGSIFALLQSCELIEGREKPSQCLTAQNSRYLEIREQDDKQKGDHHGKLIEL